MQDQLIAEPTSLDQLVSELNHSGKSQYTGVLFPVHTRLQAPLYGLIEALTHHAGTSRNKVVNQLLEVGLEATLAALPEDLAEDLRRRSGEVIHESLSKNGGTWERGEA